MDTPNFINTGLEEQIFKTYKCPTCGLEKEIAVEYSKVFKVCHPVHLPDTLCTNHEDEDEIMEDV